MEKILFPKVQTAIAKPILNIRGERGIFESALAGNGSVNRIPFLARSHSSDEVVPGISRICTTISEDGLITLGLRVNLLRPYRESIEKNAVKDTYGMLTRSRRESETKFNAEVFVSVRGNGLPDLYCLQGILIETGNKTTVRNGARIMEFGFTELPNSEVVAPAKSITARCLQIMRAAYETKEHSHIFTATSQAKRD